jgi:putative salt-induced outer membrane protein YdiY
MNNYSLRIALAILSLSFAFSAIAADRVVMKNGDVITGDVSLIDGSDVYIDPSYADKFAVSLAEVATIELDESLQVELADKTVEQATLKVNAAGEQVIVVDGAERPFSLTDIAEAKAPEPYFNWSALADLNASYNSGNTDSQNTLLYAQGTINVGEQQHYANFTLRDEETNGVKTQDQTLFNYAYSWYFNEPWYIGGSATYERDPVRELTYRYTLGAVVGRNLIENSTTFLTFSVGAGYSDEEIGGVKESGTVGLFAMRYEQSYTDWMTFYLNNNTTQQFYGNNNLIIKTVTGVRFDLVGDLYANVGLRYDYETEPAPGNTKDDSTLQVGLGYKF